jgi:ABC-type nickel/cobalt efflux system permease component RcnA
VDRVDVSGSDDAYWELFNQLWSAREAFTIVEQDTEIHSGVFKSFSRCDELWCAYLYEGPGYTTGGDTLIAALGCTRFRTELMVAESDLITKIALFNDDVHVPLKSWRRMDSRIDAELRRRGYTCHRHSPPVRHHHVYHGHCACGRTHAEYPVDREGRFDG